MDNLAELQEDHNPDLGVEGIVINQFNSQARLPGELVAELKEEGYPVFDTYLNTSVKMKESHREHRPLIDMAPQPQAPPGNFWACTLSWRRPQRKLLPEFRHKPPSPQASRKSFKASCGRFGAAYLYKLQLFVNPVLILLKFLPVTIMRSMSANGFGPRTALMLHCAMQAPVTSYAGP